METLTKILIFFHIIQVRETANKYTNEKMVESRFNPLNPLTYILLIIAIPISLTIDGLKKTLGMLSRIFKWW